MKKVKIQANRNFYDTVEQRHIKKNSVYIVDFERAEEIAKHPKDLITILEVFEESFKDNDIIHPLNEKTKKELIELAKERNIKVTGLKKAEIIEKLIETK